MICKNGLLKYFRKEMPFDDDDVVMHKQINFNSMLQNKVKKNLKKNFRVADVDDDVVLA